MLMMLIIYIREQMKKFVTCLFDFDHVLHVSPTSMDGRFGHKISGNFKYICMWIIIIRINTCVHPLI